MVTFLGNKDVIGNLTYASEDCVELTEHDKILSDKKREIFDIVNFGLICIIVGLFGIIANILNICVFYKQGFKNTVNVGFFGLAISDVICLITLQWVCICLNPLFGSSGIPWYPIEVMYISGALSHVCFSRITGFITVYITAERYLSIALPFKVKEIITPRLTSLILCLIYLVNLITFVPEYATSYLGWKFVAVRNKTLIALIFTSSRNSVEGVVYVLHSVLGMASFVGVILFTTLLVAKLRQSSQWRKDVTSNPGQRVSMSRKDQKVVKLVVLIAGALIACYTPGAIIALAMFILGPEYSITGKYVNISEAMCSIAFSCQAVNSSVNIFLYYSTSSKYRQTFDEMFLNRKSVLTKPKTVLYTSLVNTASQNSPVKRTLSTPAASDQEHHATEM